MEERWADKTSTLACAGGHEQVIGLVVFARYRPSLHCVMVRVVVAACWRGKQGDERC